MRVIKPAKIIQEEKVEKEFTCPKCGAVIGYNQDDLYFDYDSDISGLALVCPECDKISIVDPCGPIDFPKAFFHYGNGVPISDEEIKGWIKQGIYYLSNHWDESYWYTGTGDSFVVIFREYDEDEMGYNVRVMKNYWENYVDQQHVSNL